MRKSFKKKSCVRQRSIDVTFHYYQPSRMQRAKSHVMFSSFSPSWAFLCLKCQSVYHAYTHKCSAPWNFPRTASEMHLQAGSAHWGGGSTSHGGGGAPLLITRRQSALLPTGRVSSSGAQLQRGRVARDQKGRLAFSCAWLPKLHKPETIVLNKDHNHTKNVLVETKQRALAIQNMFTIFNLFKWK